MLLLVFPWQQQYANAMFFVWTLTAWQGTGFYFRPGWVILSQCGDSVFRWLQLRPLQCSSLSHCNEWSLYAPSIVTGACPDLMPGSVVFALLTRYIYEWVEAAVKGLSVAALCKYTEGSGCSVHRDAVKTKGEVQASPPCLSVTSAELDGLHSSPRCSTYSQDKYELEQQSWVV